MKCIKNIPPYIVLFSFIVFSGCSKDNNDGPINLTALEITIMDSLGYPVGGVKVGLFPSQKDFSNATNRIGPIKTSDTLGIVKFRNLDNDKIYYWFAENGCYNNWNTVASYGYPLQMNETKTVETFLTRTGHIKLVSNLTIHSRVFVNGEGDYPMPAGSTFDLKYMPVGAYAFRVQPVNGGPDLFYNEQLACGDTLVISYP